MLEQIVLPVTKLAEVTLYLKRDDLLHPIYGGNKVRKLKYNVLECKQQGKTGLLTCGGAYSNHILATAAYGKEQHLKTKAIIRGDELIADNPTLKDAAALGMEFVFVNREVYKAIREEPSKVYQLSNSNELEYFFIPEGGTNALAVKGVAELIGEIDIPFDYIATPCGTGATCAGLLKGLKDRTERLLVFSALKNGDYIIKAVKDLLKEEYNDHTLELFTSAYSFGGYA
ncbi:MAG: pyridoxal-phosphate dependent enzyme, partial [Cytophagales bacterium]|nr:pyridoxal-phosphate dependent enzyme [Cytophaga sp.]